MPIAKKNIPQEFLDQMKSNLKKNESEEIVSKEIPISEKNTVLKDSSAENINEAKKEKYADVMNIRLSKGRRNEIKTFCSSCGISITQYIESSFEFLEEEVAAGRIVISKGGIKRVEE